MNRARVGRMLFLCLMTGLLTMGCISYHVEESNSKLKNQESTASELRLYCEGTAAELRTPSGQPWCTSTVESRWDADVIVEGESFVVRNKSGDLGKWLFAYSLGIIPHKESNPIQTTIHIMNREGKVLDTGVYRSHSTVWTGWLMIPLWFVAPFSDSFRMGTNDERSQSLWEVHREIIQTELPDVRSLTAVQTLATRQADRRENDAEIWKNLRGSQSNLLGLYEARDRCEFEQCRKRIQYVIEQVINEYARGYAMNQTNLNPDWPVVVPLGETRFQFKHLFTAFALTDAGDGKRNWEIIDGRQCFREKLHTGSYCLRWVEPNGRSLFLVIVPDGASYTISTGGANGIPFQRYMRTNIEGMLKTLNNYPDPEKQRNPAILKLPVPNRLYQRAEEEIPVN